MTIERPAALTNWPMPRAFDLSLALVLLTWPQNVLSSAK